MTKADRFGRSKVGGGPSMWLAAPALAFFVLFAIVPLFGVVFLSFMNWDGLGAPQWAGLANWTSVLKDATTTKALILTVEMLVLNFCIQAPISLLLGVFMAGHQRYRAVLSVIYFLPLLFSSVATGLAFKSLLDPNFGLGTALKLDWLNKDWLGNPSLALPALVVVLAWSFVPFHSLLYQGAVRQIPTSMLEAAKIDGASRVRTFFSVILPQLKNTFITSTTLMVVGSFTYFDLIYVMTQGGPGDATRVLPLDMYLRGFKSFDMGGAAVVGVIIAVLGLTTSYALNRAAGTGRMDSQMEGA